MENTIGKRIKTRRKELNITLTQIQEKTNISSGNLSCLENGKYLPSALALIELSSILECSIDWILTGKYPNPEKENLPVAETDEEIFLLEAFRGMSLDDREELLAIAKIKNEKGKKEKYYNSENEQVKIS